ncbi:hypothetical protein Btru_062275 [Bulinus truncatus]|nr:hypothetical protein Btru_062275 [Bulinus truncatus]
MFRAVFNTSQGSGGGTSDQSDWTKALRLHQDLLKLHGVDPTCLMHSSTGDDVTSDGSGESTTCDSGRGGSEEDNGSHGRASPVNKDVSSFNNLNNPPRPLRQSFGQKVPNIPRSGFPLMTIRQHSNTPSLDAKSPTGSMRSFSGPPVKHVSFRDDFHQEWSDAPIPPVRGPVSRPGEDRWGSTFGVELQRSNLRGQGGDLNLILDHSFDTGDDGNSTTTSGSYTVDDLSPRAVNIHSYHPEQAVV